MTDAEFLHQYIDAAIESTTRTRQILLVMIVSSILVFTAFWNTREGGWVNSRLKQARQDVALAEKRVEGVRASYVDEAKLMWLQRIRAEQVSQIQVPFLGISFDVNDLGMLGGFAFVVLLVWVNYSLWHQSNNIRMAFSLAEVMGADKAQAGGVHTTLYYTYQNLAMRQVLTIPPRPHTARGESDDEKNFWLKLPKALYALPLLVHTFVVVHDLVTIDTAWVLTRWGTIFVVVLECLLWVVLYTLTLICFLRWRKTYETWKAFADKI